MKAKILDRTADQVIAWSRVQVRNPKQDWTGLCQSHCRQSYGVPAWASSAILAWERIPAAHRHPSANPSDAPRGALLYYRGGKYGHVAIAIGTRTNQSCLSNDYVRRGEIDVAPRDFKRWGLQYVGWSTWTPFGSLQTDAPLSAKVAAKQ